MKKKVLAAVLAGLFILSCLPLCAWADTYGSVDKAINSVARIVATGNVYLLDAKGNPVSLLLENTQLSHGSCFAVGERGKPVSYFVTNRHVITTEPDLLRIDVDGDGKTEMLALMATNFFLVMDNEVNMHPLTVITDNPGGADLGIVMLREPTTQREPIYLAPYTDPAKLRGETVYSVGFPGSQAIFIDSKQSLASGLDQISTRPGEIDHELNAAQSNGHGTLLLTNTPMSHGNSGGPLVNQKGAVRGVCVMGAGEEDANMNAAVSVNEVIRLLKQHGVPYMTENEAPGGWTFRVLIIAAGALVAVAAVLLLKKSGKGKKGESAYRLQGLTGVYAGKRFPISRDLRIGRDPVRNDLVYPGDNKKISGTHCVILLRNNELYIQDCGSRNGTFVNDRQMEAGVARRLMVGDTLSLADRENSFRIDVSRSKK